MLNHDTFSACRYSLPRFLSTCAVMKVYHERQLSSDHFQLELIFLTFVTSLFVLCMVMF
jgi:hypothetical protein